MNKKTGVVIAILIALLVAFGLFKKDAKAPVSDEEQVNSTEVSANQVFENDEVRITFPTEISVNEDNTYVEFGEIQLLPEAPAEEMGYFHSMNIIAPRSIEEIKAEVENDELMFFKEERMVNGFTVALHSEAGLCAYPKVEVLTETANYLFTTRCGGGMDSEYEYYVDIVETMERK